MRAYLCRLALIGLSLAWTSAVVARPGPAEARAERIRGLAAARAGQWEAARSALERSLTAEPAHPEALYALALCGAQAGEAEWALGHLERALEAGFQDYALLGSDPRLASLRERPAFQELLKRAEARRDRFDAELEGGARESYAGTSFRVERHRAPRLVLVTDAEETMAASLVEALRGWEAGHRAALFADGLRHAIVVHAPKPTSTDGGPLAALFSPAARTLHVNLAAPPGLLLAEWTRALHFDDQAAHGQIHPPWLAAGLPALYERARLTGEGLVALDDGRLPELAQRIGTPEWTGLPQLLAAPAAAMRRPAVAQARALLLWLQEAGRLRPFYRALVERYEEEATGRLALEAVCERPLAEVEEAWTAWLRARP
jgi:hypothetical protein